MIKHNEWKKYIWYFLIGFIIFVLLQIVPSISSLSQFPNDGKAIPKSEASIIAEQFASDLLNADINNIDIYHQSDKLVTGYIAKESLEEDYLKSYDNIYPYNQYQANLTFSNGLEGFVYLNMYTGEVTGWNLYTDSTNGLTSNETKSVIAEQLPNHHLSSTQMTYVELNNGAWLLESNEIKIGEAPLQITAAVQDINGEPVVTQYKPQFTVPDHYIKEVDKQDTIAKWLTYAGSMLFSIVMGILAIVYAILYRKYTSFKFGIFLAIVAGVTGFIVNVALGEGSIISDGEVMIDSLMKVLIVILAIVAGFFGAVSSYFSIVAGDGLWKAQGFHNIWPRFKEQGYGDYVWRSMGLSYMFAIILMAIQAILFVGLSLIIGSWGANDISTSSYNMSWPWILPVLAWLAAISEEAVYRFFGIGIFRRWIKNTFVAACIPTFFWALGHTLYPFYPATTRIIELMIIGLLFSFIFMKYGFITAMFTHAIFNSVATGIQLYMMGGTVNYISATFFIVLPLIIAYFIRLWHRKKGMNSPNVNHVENHPLEPQV